MCSFVAVCNSVVFLYVTALNTSQTLLQNAAHRLKETHQSFRVFISNIPHPSALVPYTCCMLVFTGHSY